MKRYMELYVFAKISLSILCIVALVACSTSQDKRGQSHAAAVRNVESKPATSTPQSNKSITTENAIQISEPSEPNGSGLQIEDAGLEESQVEDSDQSEASPTPSPEPQVSSSPVVYDVRRMSSDCHKKNPATPFWDGQICTRCPSNGRFDYKTSVCMLDLQVGQTACPANYFLTKGALDASFKVAENVMCQKTVYNVTKMARCTNAGGSGIPQQPDAGFDCGAPAGEVASRKLYTRNLATSCDQLHGVPSLEYEANYCRGTTYYYSVYVQAGRTSVRQTRSATCNIAPGVCSASIVDDPDTTVVSSCSDKGVYTFQNTCEGQKYRGIGSCELEEQAKGAVCSMNP